jgi:hypothetical protein
MEFDEARFAALLRNLMKSFASVKSFASMTRVLSICILSMIVPVAPCAMASSAPSASQESALKEFIALEPVDAHTHVYRDDPAFSAMLQRLHLHVLDVLVVDVKDDATHRTLDSLKQGALQFVSSNPGRASLSTTFNPFTWNDPGFPSSVIASLNQDFAHGAVGMTTWTNLGMVLKDASGKPVMLDDPKLQLIYKDIAAKHKTLIAHITTADEAWSPATDASSNPQSSVPAILQSRDRILQQNPHLRVVGAHLGSLKDDLDQVGRRMEQYPDFAVDTSGRIDYLTTQPREQVLAFLLKFQDRILYGSDLGFRKADVTGDAIELWQSRYALDWRYFSSDDTFDYKGRQVHGLHLPAPVLRKLFRDNAIRWVPGIAH